MIPAIGHTVYFNRQHLLTVFFIPKRKGHGDVAYPRKIKQKARRLWLEGLPFREIPARLATSFPNEKTPKDHVIIFQWSKADDWDADKAIIDERIKQNHNESLTKIADEIAARDKRVLQVNDVLIAQIATHVQQRPGQAPTFRAKTTEGVEVEYQLLDPKAIQQLAGALNTASKRGRIVGLGYDELKRVVLPDGTTLTPEDS
jgi:hypothetical protein